jgi:hypothetical protein
MALTENTAVDKIEIVNADTIPMIQVREATVVARDGTEIARNFHRYVVSPDVDTTTLTGQVRALAESLFTTEVKAAYAAKLAETAE